MSLRCTFGYHAFDIVDVTMTTISGSDDKYTVCVLKEYKCKRCGARDFKQVWESEACKQFWDNYPCSED